MNTEDIYQRLLQILRELNLDWVAQEVEQQVLIGSIDVKNVQTVIEREDLHHNQPTLYNLSDENIRLGRSAEYMAVQQYSPKEKLNLLLDAIDQVTVNLTDIKRSALSLMSEHGNIRGIEFVNVQDGEQSHRLDIEDIHYSSQAEDAIKSVINQLRGI